MGLTGYASLAKCRRARAFGCARRSNRASRSRGAGRSPRKTAPRSKALRPPPSSPKPSACNSIERKDGSMAAVLERQKIEVRPTGAALGADIGGVDLAEELSAETLDAIKQAWADHLVLRF